MAMVLSNGSTTTLAAALSAGSNSLTIQPSDAVLFPVLGEGDWHPLTVTDAAGNSEILRVTARAGAILTVKRAQEGTTAKTFAIGSRADVRLTAGALLEAMIASQFVRKVAKKTGEVELMIEDIELLEASLNTIDTAIANYKTNFDKIDLTKDKDKPVSDKQKEAIDLKLDIKGGENLGGFKSVPVDHGNASGKNIVLSCDVRHYHSCKNNGNFTITAPPDGWYTTVLYLENVAAAGSITFVGYGTNVFGEVDKAVGKKYQLISVHTGSFKTLTIRGEKE